jgi:hypothetical protein
LSSTIITVFGILRPSEEPGGQPRRGGLACIDSSPRGEKASADLLGNRKQGPAH